MLCGWVFKERPRPVTVEAREDLELWLNSLKDFDKSRLIRTRTAAEIGWVGDASTSFGIGIFIGSSWCQFELKEGWQDSGPFVRGIAWLETVAIRLGLVMLKKKGIIKGRTFIVWTDNTVSQSAVKQRKSGDRSVNDEWKNIQKFLLNHDCDIKAKRVASEDNRADGLSRGVRANRDINHELEIEVPLDLNGILVQVFDNDP
jgi:hypothetical protein